MRVVNRAGAARWASVAAERGRDADGLHAADRKLASIYFYGFMVECYAKALGTAVQGKHLVTHDLIVLLEYCGLRRQDLPSELAAFADSRDVSLRYREELPPHVDYVARGLLPLNWRSFSASGLTD